MVQLYTVSGEKCHGTEQETEAVGWLIYVPYLCPHAAWPPRGHEYVDKFSCAVGGVPLYDGIVETIAAHHGAQNKQPAYSTARPWAPPSPCSSTIIMDDRGRCPFWLLQIPRSGSTSSEATAARRGVWAPACRRLSGDLCANAYWGSSKMGPVAMLRNTSAVGGYKAPNQVPLCIRTISFLRVARQSVAPATRNGVACGRARHA